MFLTLERIFQSRIVISTWFNVYKKCTKLIKIIIRHKIPLDNQKCQYLFYIYIDHHFSKRISSFKHIFTYKTFIQWLLHILGPYI